MRGGTDGLHNRNLGDLYGHVGALAVRLVSTFLFTVCHRSVWYSKSGSDCLAKRNLVRVSVPRASELPHKVTSSKYTPNCTQ